MISDRYSLGECVRFTAEGGLERYLIDGWSSPEEGHRWTIGATAGLGFSFADIGKKDLRLRVNASAFFPAATHSHQQVEVRANYRKVAVWEISGQAWHEATIPNSVVRAGKLRLTFQIECPASPHDSGLSDDTRQLGMMVTELELSRSVEDPLVEWHGSGDDPVGDVLQRNGSFFRAIKASAINQVATLQKHGVYDVLAARKLIPPQTIASLTHSKYAALTMSPGALWKIYPADYVFLTLRDAALVWLDISEYLGELNFGVEFGLIDGHYGNFALFDNSRPTWVDVGSIIPLASGTNEFSSGSFAIEQFIRCFIYPLQMYFHQPERKDEIRSLMHAYPGGIPNDIASEFLGDPILFKAISQPDTVPARKLLFQSVRRLVNTLEYRGFKTMWSDYRNFTALEWALEGKYLQHDQDARFRMVMALTNRQRHETFVDVGANDGLWSIMCARHGMAGIATDVDDDALNRLYQFLGSHPELAICVAHTSFLNVDLNHVGDLVLALALTHHLYLSQDLSFDEIAGKLANVCRKALITEFMPDGLGGTPGYPEPSPNPLPAGYALAAYLESLETYFDHVEVIEYERINPISRRVLIYCEKAGGQHALGTMP